jgi:hypothetical protein
MKSRIPSFPDKVLVNDEKPLLTTVFYGAMLDVHGNDHRPVTRLCSCTAGNVHSLNFITWNIGDFTPEKLRTLKQAYKGIVANFAVNKDANSSGIVICLQECRFIYAEDKTRRIIENIFHEYKAHVSPRMGFTQYNIHKQILSIVLVPKQGISQRPPTFKDVSPPNTKHPLFTSNFPAMLISLPLGDDDVRILSCHAPFVRQEDRALVNNWWKTVQSKLGNGVVDAICGDLNSRIHFSNATFPFMNYVIKNGRDEQLFLNMIKTPLSQDTETKKWALYNKFDSLTGKFHSRNPTMELIRSSVCQLLDISEESDAYWNMDRRRYYNHNAPSYHFVKNADTYDHVPRDKPEIKHKVKKRTLKQTLQKDRDLKWSSNKRKMPAA